MVVHNSLTAIIQQGNALLRQNRLDEAEAVFKDGMARYPGHPVPKERFAHVAVLRPDCDAAYARYASLRASHPGNPAGYVGQGNVLLRLGLIDEAREHFRESVGLFPDNAQIMERLGHVARLAGDPDEAYALYGALRRDHPDNPAGFAVMAGVLLDLELFDEAGECLQEGLARFPDHPGLKELHARTALRGLDFDTAYVRYADLERSHPDSPSGCLGAGSVLFALRLYDEAEEHFRRGMERFPDSPAMMDRYAQVALLRQDDDAAYARYAALRKAHPDSPLGCAGHGEILLRQRLVDEAEEVLAEGIARFPGQVMLRQQYAMAAMRRWDFDAATSRFEELVRLHPYNAAGYIGKANVLVQSNRNDEAESFVRCCLSMFPHNVVFLEMYAYISFRKMKYEEAYNIYKDIVILYPRSIIGYLGLVRIMFKRKMFDEAYDMMLKKMASCFYDIKFLQHIIGYYMDSLAVNIHIRKPELTDLMLSAYARIKRDDVVGPCYDPRRQLRTQLLGARILARVVNRRPSEAGPGRPHDGGRTLLLFGDSHLTATFQCPSQFRSYGVKARLFPVPGASIAGLGRRCSTLSLVSKIEKCISMFAPDYLLLKFGQVDIDHGYHRKNCINGIYRINFSTYCEGLIETYLNGIEHLGNYAKLAVCSINLPSITSSGCLAKKVLDVIVFGECKYDSVNYHKTYVFQPSFLQRTRWNLEFNAKLGSRCQARGIKFIDQTPLFLNKETNLVHEHFSDDNDVHYVTSDLHRAQIVAYTMERFLRE